MNGIYALAYVCRSMDEFIKINTRMALIYIYERKREECGYNKGEK